MSDARRLAILLALATLLCGCSEEGFRQGGHDMLSGICAKASNCTVNCSEGQKPNEQGRCVPSPY